MGGRCNYESVFYQTNIFPMENINDKKVNMGILAENWKQIICNYKHSFNNPLLRNQSILFLLFEEVGCMILSCWNKFIRKWRFV